jgi:hypothetical protein
MLVKVARKEYLDEHDAAMADLVVSLEASRRPGSESFWHPLVHIVQHSASSMMTHWKRMKESKQHELLAEAVCIARIV